MWVESEYFLHLFAFEFEPEASTKKPSVHLHRIMKDNNDCTVCFRSALFALGVGDSRVRRAT